MAKRTYTKKDELSFNVKETRELSQDINIVHQMNMMMGYVQTVRKTFDEQIRKGEDAIVRIANEYNFWVEIMEEAQKKMHLPFKVPKKMPTEFKDFDFDNLPEIELINPAKETIDVEAIEKEEAKETEDSVPKNDETEEKNTGVELDPGVNK